MQSAIFSCMCSCMLLSVCISDLTFTYCRNRSLQEASANQMINKRDMKQNGKVTDIHLDNVDLTYGEK